MKLYNDYILPVMLDHLCGTDDIAEQRRKVVPRANGLVLEVGMGTGLNLPIYNETAIDKVIGLDPSTKSFKKAERRAQRPDFPVEYLGMSGESIPLAHESVDTVVLTYTLCSISNPGRALAEMRRVLKPGGKLLFCEHGKAPAQRLFRVQRRLTPLWKRVVGGCHLDRDIPDLIQQGGFRIEELDSDYVLRSWLVSIASFQYWGVARAR